MNARQFYDLVVEMRKAQKRAGVTFDYEDIRKMWAIEIAIDAEIERVTKILRQRDEQLRQQNNQHTNGE